MSNTTYIEEARNKFLTGLNLLSMHLKDEYDFNLEGWTERFVEDIEPILTQAIRDTEVKTANKFKKAVMQTTWTGGNDHWVNTLADQIINTNQED